MQNSDDGNASLTLSTSSICETNKSDIVKSPLKCKKLFTGSSTNLDKVIEAVSKGILDDSPESMADLKTNHIEVSPVKSPKVNGFQAKLNDSKSSVGSEASEKTDKIVSPCKAKASKKAKKEKEKDKEKDKDKDKDKEKIKDKPKERDRLKEKTKRKSKLKPAAELPSCQPKIEEIKEEKPQTEKEEQTELANSEANKNESKVLENHTETKKLNNSVDSTITLEVNAPNSTQPLGESTFNGDGPDAHHTLTIEIATTSTTIAESDAVRKQSRKRRKEKHRNKHGQDAERSSSKEHKKKRKRKSHDHEHPEQYPLADGVPKIKIKVSHISL